ncbi:hypothetical protein DPMN_084764 [Dreissena polymorpha]|uniref:Uncharacterized protein n=1 Tax=Dreissena polymorpha TaxID=45954 RepID=A0A9D3YCD7_DREPO|nr:hypothetical protein DPMN_084764 [Dreissena polymorpha]
MVDDFLNKHTFHYNQTLASRSFSNYGAAAGWLISFGLRPASVPSHSYPKSDKTGRWC